MCSVRELDRGGGTERGIAGSGEASAIEKEKDREKRRII